MEFGNNPLNIRKQKARLICDRAYVRYLEETGFHYSMRNQLARVIPKSRHNR